MNDVNNDDENEEFDINDAVIEYISGDFFIYALDEKVDAILSKHKVITLFHKFNHFCYEDLPELYKHVLLINVNAVNDQPITYRQAFNAADKAVNKYYDELAVKYNIPKQRLFCDHVFIEDFEQLNATQYEIVCGS